MVIFRQKTYKKLHFRKNFQMLFLIKHHILKETGVSALKKVFDFIKSSKKKFQVKIDSKFKKEI